MKLLITGAAGFVGAELIRQALTAGHDVVALVRSRAAAVRLDVVHPQLAIVEADLRAAEEVRSVLESHRPDAIAHLGWSGVANHARFDRSQILDNLNASCQLLESGVAAGIRKFVGVGSQGEYGRLDGRIDERHLPEPTTLYGATKAATMFLTRQLAAQANIEFAWLRLFSTYGPDDNQGWLIPSLTRDMLAGRRPKTTHGTQRWDYLFVADAARGILAAAVTPGATGIFNLGSGEAVTVRSVIEAVRDFAAPNMELIFGEIPFRPDQVWHMEADNTRLKEATGWSPKVNMRDGIAETVAWYRDKLARETVQSERSSDG